VSDQVATTLFGMDLFATIAESIQVNFPALIEYKYVFLFIVITLEGFSGIILAGFMVSLGTVSALPTFLIAVIGDFLNGLGWYAVGYFGGTAVIDKWGRRHPKSRKAIETLERYFNRYSGRAIILTKLTWSVTIFMMIIAGSFKYNLKKFTLYSFIGGTGYVIILFTAGYFFGKGYKAISFVNNIGLTILFFACAIFVVYAIRVLTKPKFVERIDPKDTLPG
jgi:membrane protein DedA with SNARE-associated domain